MMRNFRDITVLCAVVLALAIGAFGGSAAAILFFRQEQAREMVAMRSAVEPAMGKLFVLRGPR